MLWFISINSIQFQLVPWSSSPKSLDSHEQLVWNWDSLLTNDIGILWGGSLFPQAHSLVDLNSFYFLCKSIDTFTNSFYQQFLFHGYFDSCDFSLVFSFSFSPPSFFFCRIELNFIKKCCIPSFFLICRFFIGDHLLSQLHVVIVVTYILLIGPDAMKITLVLMK